LSENTRRAWLPRMNAVRPTLVVLALAWASIVPSALVLAQPTALTADALAAHIPATLGGVAHGDRNVYSDFVTATYYFPDGTVIALQFHDARGAGSEAYQRSVCPRFAIIAGYEACVTPRSGAVYLSWVLADTVQVILGGAPDEATATRLAASLPLAALARLAGVR
jgi:hypothetical protein